MKKLADARLGIWKTHTKATDELSKVEAPKVRPRDVTTVIQAALFTFVDKGT